MCGRAIHQQMLLIAPINQSINQSMEFVKRLLQSWTMALDRSKLQ